MDSAKQNDALSFPGDTERITTWDALPRSSQLHWIRISRPLWDTVTRSVRNGSANATDAMLNAINSVHNSLSRGAGGTNSVKRLNQRLTSIARGDLIIREPYAPPRDRPAPGDDNNKRLAARVAFIAMSGTRYPLHRAVRTTQSSPPAPINDATIKELRRLHPPSTGQLPPLPNGATPPVITPQEVQKVIERGVASGAAPGPDGWTGEQLQPLMDDSDSVNGVTTVINLLVSNTAPEPIRRQLCASRCLPVTKPDGGGIRPIWMGNAILKVASACALDRVSEHHSKIFPSIQMGIGVKGGSEVAVHTIQSALESTDDSVVLKLDITNAFNSRDRTAIAKALYARPETQPLWHLFHTVYGHTNTGLVYRPDRSLAARIPQANGATQGCLLGTFCFCVSMQKPYESAIANTDVIAAVAVVDDFTVVGTTASVAAVLDNFRRICTEEKLHLNLSKCKLLWPRLTNPPQSLQSLATDNGMQLHVGSMKVLGAWVGGNHRSIQTDLLNKVQTDHTRFFQILPHLSSQLSLLLLRACGVPRLHYLSRTHFPSDFKAAAQTFDRMVRDQLQRVTTDGNESLSERAFTQLSLPMKMAGAAFRSYVETSAAAFLAAAAQSIHLIPTGLPPNSPYVTAIEESIQSIRQRSVPSLTSSALPSSFAEMWDRFRSQPGPDSNAINKTPHHFQRTLTKLTESVAAAKLRTEGSPADAARLIALTQPHALVWLKVRPEANAYQLSNYQVKQQLRLMIGMAPSSTALICLCGSTLTHDHALSCLKIRKLCTESRHDAVLDAVVKLSRDCNVSVRRENRVRLPNGKPSPRQRPDLLFDGAGLSLMSDVAVTTPSCKSIVALGSDTQPLRAAELREASKRTKYQSIADAAECQLIPFVLESYGGWGPGAREVIHRLTQVAVSYTGGGTMTELDVLSHARKSISLALVVGNARLASTAIRLARRRRINAVAPNPPAIVELEQRPSDAAAIPAPDDRSVAQRRCIVVKRHKRNQHNHRPT
jgi:hypothetical protein